MIKPKRKLDPRVYMGICSAIAYAAGLGIQAYRFGWEDVPAYWIYAGVVVIVVLLGSGLLFRGRERRRLREAIDRSSVRYQAARRSSPVAEPGSDPHTDRSDPQPPGSP